MRRAVRLLLVAVAVGGVVFLFVLPGRIYLAQRRDMSAAHRQESTLTKENAALAKQVSQLQNPAYIEQIARLDYGLVMPGETVYGILLPATPPTTLPPAKAQAHPRHS
jgi:cell division protein FtsB